MNAPEPRPIAIGAYGGLLSLLALVAAVFFLALATFQVAIGDIPEIPAGLFCGFLSFLLARFGV